jgi:hypothetical protein
VLLPPDLGEPIRGREAVVESYGEFLRAARLNRFDITGLETFTFEPAPEIGRSPLGGRGRDERPGHRTHMAHLEFRIIYELGGERYVDTGLEVYTVVEEGGRCSIVWRGQTILDSRLAEKSDPDQKA